MGLDVFVLGALLGCAAYFLAFGLLGTWFPDGSEDEGGEPCGD
jgi:hypothetical protein